ncbi:peroxidase family protein, partial [Oleiphilus sp. HI0117]
SVQRTTADPDRSVEDDAYLPATYRNHNTHWWDGSQLYGSNKETNDSVRSFEDGKLAIESDGTLPTDFWSGVPVTGFSDNWWLGLSMMHQLFTLEHNAIADKLKENYPNATDQWLFDKSRLINSALMAKIHTVEWTPAIIANPALELSMEANWWGIARNPETRDLIQNVTDDIKGPNSWLINTIALFDPEKAEQLSTPGAIDHILGGLVGQSKPNNYDVPYVLTEEFVAVYRMHPLLRDAVDIYDIGSNVVSERINIEDTRDGDAEDILDNQGGDRLWYSFGITHPGSLTLNNYPEFLRNLSMPLIGDIDLATIDIIRDRERGVPRYNEFRRQIGLNPITKFEDLTEDPTTLAELKRVYNNDIEQIDALVGQLAETVRPDGFAFGETAFQVFILNASRRLMTDRFYTESYTPEVYTQEGIDWVENNTMVDVIRRHFPELELSLTGVDNAFKPWGLKIPDNYKEWSACDKEQLLWTNGAMRTEYDAGERPGLTDIDIGGLINTVLWEKVNRKDDVAPLGYEKPIHAHAAMATTTFEPASGHPYTGVFKGAECGLLRLSVTGDPNDRGFAPGLAWKVFVDGRNSRNVSALYTLSGQGGNHDFFANELSQYVDKEVNETLGTTALFSLVSTKPTTLSVEKMAKVRADGTKESSVVTPTQVYFVPRPEVKGLFSSASHDFRDDLESLPEGTPIYDVYATSEKIRT